MPDWSDADDAIIAGDLTAALAYLTPAEGAVVTPVAPVGLRDRAAGTVGFTTSLGFGQKLERIDQNPNVALAYHAREHGFAHEPRFVLVQGKASYDADPDRATLEALRPAAARFMGPPQTGLFWDRWLSAYYADRVLVTVQVERVVSWPDSRCAGEATVVGSPIPAAAPPNQAAPSGGVGPRIDVVRAARRLRALPHVLLAYRGGDGLPAIVAVNGGRRRPGGHLARGGPPGRLAPRRPDGPPIRAEADRAGDPHARAGCRRESTHHTPRRAFARRPTRLSCCWPTASWRGAGSSEPELNESFLRRPARADRPQPAASR